MMCLTLVLPDFPALQSVYLALSAASQSKGERTDLALNGDLAVVELIGES